MAKPRFQRSIRFSQSEWNAVCEVAERRNMKPAEFVHEAAARAATDGLYLYGGGLTRNWPK